MVALEPRVAVVDDDESIRRALGRLLRVEGFVSEGFASALDYMEAAKKQGYDCLVLDIHLGGMSGIELVEKLSGEGDGIPVILITAHDDETTRERACASGVAAYLRKPLDADTLLAEVHKAVDVGRGTP